MNVVMKIVSIACFFLLHVHAQEEFDYFGTAYRAFDDQYIGCRDEMDRKMQKDNMIEMEKIKNKDFKIAWEEAEYMWKNVKKDQVISVLPRGFHDLHGTAIVAYTGFIGDDFNNALKLAGESRDYYIKNFHYKSLHFYLTVGMELLSNRCKTFNETVYKIIDEFPSYVTYPIKFGHFLSTTYKLYGNYSFLTIITQCGVKIDKFSQYPEEMEVLVPGYEMFEISDYAEEYQRIVLTSIQKSCSNYNCAYIGGRLFLS
ncbi:T-cell ecto-ADP-ribosyltransferase 2-like [Bombina bombina]|uniref:T-cell ecto-ADP-ribosyltransferase 2-like n=1 Tax=Bombina bombina TaxID=8345 RepID=UPI00235B07A6|nr:T-cell ecto-ADP-ribosyltransferase 2-like [Bombina bombina]